MFVVGSPEQTGEALSGAIPRQGARGCWKRCQAQARRRRALWASSLGLVPLQSDNVCMQLWMLMGCLVKAVPPLAGFGAFI